MINISSSRKSKWVSDPEPGVKYVDLFPLALAQDRHWQHILAAVKRQQRLWRITRVNRDLIRRQRITPR